jgi:hypothetical protein
MSFLLFLCRVILLFIVGNVTFQLCHILIMLLFKGSFLLFLCGTILLFIVGNVTFQLCYLLVIGLFKENILPPKNDRLIERHPANKNIFGAKTWAWAVNKLNKLASGKRSTARNRKRLPTNKNIFGAETWALKELNKLNKLASRKRSTARNCKK